MRLMRREKFFLSVDWLTGWREKFLVVAIIFLAFGLRYRFAAAGRFAFWFDQSRDAYLATGIIKNQDFKIQGPSASGTEDTVYHGVLYYYLIAPIYFLSGGDPIAASIFLAALSSLSLISVYILVKRVLNSSWPALITILWLAVSAEHLQLSIWLSNPTIALWPIPIFYLALWSVFYEQDKKQLGWLALSLGLLHQSAIWLCYFWGCLFVGGYYLTQVKKIALKKFFKTQDWLKFGSIFLVTISSMILAQWRLFQAGIFTLEKFLVASSRFDSFELKAIGDLGKLFLGKLLRSLTPTWPILALVLLIFGLTYLAKLSKKQQYFFWSLLTAPIWLFLVHFRANDHLLIGLEIVILILVAGSWWPTAKNCWQNQWPVVRWLVVAAMIVSQLKMADNYWQKIGSVFSPQKGVQFQQQLQMIDDIYGAAAGQPFTILTYTNPYGYNITWAYLFNWYGQQKYGYQPDFYGFDQTGFFGSELLVQTRQPAQQVFLIVEPEVGAQEIIYERYLAEIDQVTEPISDFKFYGTLKMQPRQRRPLPISPLTHD